MSICPCTWIFSNITRSFGFSVVPNTCWMTEPQSAIDVSTCSSWWWCLFLWCRFWCFCWFGRFCWFLVVALVQFELLSRWFLCLFERKAVVVCLLVLQFLLQDLSWFLVLVDLRLANVEVT